MDMSFWHSHDSRIWEEKLSQYWNHVDNNKNSVLEHKMNDSNLYKMNILTPEKFYDFLHDEYLPWIFIDSRFLKQNTSRLEKYKKDLNEMDILKTIHSEILKFDPNDVKKGLKIAKKIYGLGDTGASGLLALLYPEYFGTLNASVVEALQAVSGIAQDITSINPKSIGIKNGILVIQILKEKARVLNNTNKTTEWTPRKIDMALWITR